MRSAFISNRGIRLRLGGLVGVSTSLALMLFASDRLYAQAMGTGSKSPPKATNPTQQPVTFLKLPNHDGQAPPPVSTANADKARILGLDKGQAEARRPLQWWQKLDYSLSTLYQFSSQRSRVGQGVFDSNSAIVDFSVRYDDRPYTSADVSYIYSHISGSPPTGPKVAENQHAGFLRVLQPLNPAWNPKWQPPDLSPERLTQQLAILAGVGYGSSPGSVSLSNSLVVHSTGHTVFGDAFLDYQFAWFRLRPADGAARHYPSLLFELSSGIQCATVGMDSSTSGAVTTSSARQIDYLNTASLTYSLPCRLGFQVAIEWDAPLDSQPLRGAKPDRANTAIFSGGLVYNAYPSKKSENGSCAKPLTWWDRLCDSNRWSASVLYSYTAFDPLGETNALQLQISYSF